MELSKEQSKAVFTDSKSALCLAGAGSGKTRVLIGRIQNLIENCQVSPFEILACTFTRKAGKEMSERLEKAVENKAYGVTIGTLHSVALKMIQRFGEFVGLNPGKITVYSSWEEDFLLKDVCKELGYYNGKNWKGVKKKEIDQAFHLLYTRAKKNDRDYVANEIMDAFFVRCKENNALTYGLIMVKFLELIPRIKHMLNYRHILVDEVQDLDPLQWRIIKLLCSVCGASLFVVGDDSQSIYSFRGADPGYIIRNQDKFDIYKLKDNYRSDANIVKAANKLIKHNENRLDLKMNPIRPGLNEVSLLPNIDSINLSLLIRDLNEEPSNLDTAVLARNHVFVDKLSKLLTEAGIDHEYIGKKTAFTRSENFRRVHAFLNLAVNPFDNFSFLLCKEHFEIDIPTYKAIRLKAVMENKSHFQIWEEAMETCEDEPSQKIIDFLFEVSDNNFIELINVLRVGFDFDFDSEPVFDFISDYLRGTNNHSIHEYLDWLTLYDVQDEISEEPKKLQLMTIHASKGLEWSTVIIAGLNQGILPGHKAKGSQSELESERRLAYVAYTRARDFLVLTSRPINPESRVQCPPSQFIKESLET
jgi:DNA helicase-2/ATP-dependent DNA helicase PcrA